MKLSSRSFPQKAWINIKTGQFYPTHDYYNFVVNNPHIFNLTKDDINLLEKEYSSLTISAEKVWNKINQSFKFASSYVEKKEEESGNITYIYDEKHILKRNKDKAKKVEKLTDSIKDVRKQIKQDMSNEDYKISLPALAVALIDETFERVGNRYSARDLKHYGVTTWLKKHIKVQPSKVIIKYTGKSGVKQEKSVTDKTIIKHLKDLIKDKSPNDPIFQMDSYTLTDNHVNKYLKPFNITAKDIRGMHANREVKELLSKSKPAKEEKQRKEDFKKAIEEAAKTVGHEPSTLKNQYLVPGFEEKYIATGKIASNQFPLSKRAKDNIKEWIHNNVNSNNPLFYAATLSLLFPELTLYKEPKTQRFWTESNDAIYDPFYEESYTHKGEQTIANIEYIINHPLFKSLTIKDQNKIENLDVSGIGQRKSKIDITPRMHSNLENELYKFDTLYNKLKENNPHITKQDVIRDYIKLSPVFQTLNDKELQYATKEFYKAIASNQFPLSKRAK